jgi:hemerythrin-like metal-binding protein
LLIPDKANIVTGDSKLDFEHAQIFATLERLQDTTLSQTIRIAICEKLLHHISDHCQDEESLMKFYNFPDIENHLEAHRVLQDNFLRNLSVFIRRGGPIGLEIKEFFYNHIVNIDLPMIDFIRSQQDRN